MDAKRGRKPIYSAEQRHKLYLLRDTTLLPIRKIARITGISYGTARYLLSLRRSVEKKLNIDLSVKQ